MTGPFRQQQRSWRITKPGEKAWYKFKLESGRIVKIEARSYPDAVSILRKHYPDEKNVEQVTE